MIVQQVVDAQNAQPISTYKENSFIQMCVAHHIEFQLNMFIRTLKRVPNRRGLVLYVSHIGRIHDWPFENRSISSDIQKFHESRMLVCSDLSMGVSK